MKIIDVTALAIPDVKVIRFQRFTDDRGYFTETYRLSDFQTQLDVSFLADAKFAQCNESFSKAGVIRGLHFQWNPYMGKLVRVVHGRMVDLFLDVRRDSPFLGKAMAYDMPVNNEQDYSEWIWIPPGFAHGNFFTEPTTIEYFCTGQYSPQCEAGISPLADDIDWSMCDKELKVLFDSVVSAPALISEKDENGLTFSAWIKDDRSENFVYGKC